MNSNENDGIAYLRELIEESSQIVVFTGAGISAECGIPTYRGTGGMWSKYDPEKFASIHFFRKDPTYYWNFFRDVRYNMITGAEPGKGHLAIAELERRGKVSAVITQNIDNLHLRAGSKKVLELHGNTTRFRCIECEIPFNLVEVKEMLDQNEVPPHCKSCGGVIRPNTIMFGEMLPQDVLIEAERETSECDLMLVVGSSLVVYPAANLPYSAKMSGAKLAIINMDPTPLDSLADVLIHLPSGEVLPQAIG